MLGEWAKLELKEGWRTWGDGRELAEADQAGRTLSPVER